MVSLTPGFWANRLFRLVFVVFTRYERETERDRERQRETERDRERQRETERERQTDTCNALMAVKIARFF